MPKLVSDAQPLPTSHSLHAHIANAPQPPRPSEITLTGGAEKINEYRQRWSEWVDELVRLAHENTNAADDATALLCKVCDGEMEPSQAQPMAAAIAIRA